MDRPRWAVVALALLLAIGGIGLEGCSPSPTGPSAPGTAGAVTASPPSSGSSLSSTPSPSPTASTAPVTPSPTAVPSPTFLAYTVASGDTLTSIARRFGTTPRSIAFWNRATYPSLDPLSPTYEPDRIEVGWTLSLIPGVVVDEEDLPAPSTTPLPSVSIAPGPTPRADGSSLLVSNGSRDSTAVALSRSSGRHTARRTRLATSSP